MSEMKNNNESKNRKIEFIRPSLSQANEIESRLKSCKKIDLKDRSIFARNLGDITSSEIRKDDSLTMHKIFQKAFGNSAESMYKKRKSLITLPKETPEPKNLRSKARDYLEILTTLSRIKSKYSEETQAPLRQKLILQLVEGSSFDDQRKVKDRMYETSLSHLQGVLSFLVDKVLGEVDLDYQYAWYENYWPRATQSFENMINNFTAPSIKIADVMVPVKMEKAAFITLTNDELSLTDSKSKSVSELILEKLLKDYCCCSVDEEDMYVCHFDDLPDDLQKYSSFDEIFSKLNWIDYSEIEYKSQAEYFKRSSVFLEIRFDSWSEKWKAITAWKTYTDEVGDCNEIDRNDFWDTYYSFRNVIPEKALQLISCDWGAFEAAEFDVNEDGITYILFETDFGDRFGRHTPEFRGLRYFDSYALGNPGMSITDIDNFMMRTPEQEEYEKFKIIKNSQITKRERFAKDNFTLAPLGTFADIILNNLAYSSEENRVDNFLLKDAKEKFKAFKNHENDCNKNYFDSLASFDKQLKPKD